MKLILPILVILLNTFIAKGQQVQLLQGAWKMQHDTVTYVWIIADDCYMTIGYTNEGHRFVSASGGKFTAPAKSIELEVEFNSRQKEEVGNFHLLDYTITDDKLSTKHHNDTEIWTRIDDGRPGALTGAWLFSGRKSNANEEIKPYMPGARKTMKIMSGTRFQWAAYNTETKEFLGTGGGTYTTQNNIYTENIDVFSRDNTRVGASLSFDMEIQEPHWFHSGKSSKGDPIYERWSRRKSFAGQ